MGQLQIKLKYRIFWKFHRNLAQTFFVTKNFDFHKKYIPYLFGLSPIVLLISGASALIVSNLRI